MSSRGGRRRPLSNPGSNARPAAKDEGGGAETNEVADVVPNVSIFNQLASFSSHVMISLILHLLSCQPWYCPRPHPTPHARPLRQDIIQEFGTVDRYFDKKLRSKDMDLESMILLSKISWKANFALQDDVAAFMNWMDSTFPADAAVQNP